MKKIFVVTLVLMLLAVTVVPAFASSNERAGFGNKGMGRGPFALAGMITNLDPAVRSVTVTVVCGNKPVKPFIGQTLTLQTTNTTRFLLRNPDGTATPITFADLAVGQKISANGQLSNNTWTAQRITVGALLTCLP
jgi:hypothetical protein